MTAKARAGGYEPMIGRQDELRRTIRVLAQRKSNCPVLIGEAGVGKKSIVQGLAQKIADGQVPDVLRNKRIYELDLTALKGGASYIGQLEGRLKSVLDEVKDKPDVLLFVDEIHRLIGAGSHEGEKDVGGNAIKRPLTDGELQIVGATTNSEYREIERDAALARRFEPVSVPALTVEETLDVLYRVRDAEEKHHSIEVSEEALEAAARLSDRYIKDRNLPASAVDVVSNACSEAALSSEEEVLAQHVAAAISESTGVPVGDIGADEGQKMMHLAEAVKSRVIGQDAAADMLAEAVRRKRAGFGVGRPVSALFVGSTGTGKTETAKALALLRLLADPGDDLALVAVLRGPFFAVDDSTLHAVALSRPRDTSWWRAVEAYDGEGSEKLSAAREVLGELLGRRRVEPPSGLLALADRLTGYTAVVSNLPGPERRLADWRGFVELARGLERGHEDVFAVVRSLRRMGEAGVGVPRLLLAAGDAVSLMTIHSAKGLEWPVVIVPDLSRTPRSSSPVVLFDPEVGVGVDFGDDVDGEESKPVLHKLVKDQLQLARGAEDRRLFYVALTRARDHLILTTTDNQTRGDSGLTLLRPGLEAAGVEVEPVPFRPEDVLAPEPSTIDPGNHGRLLI